MLRVKLFETIRREHRDGASIRGLADDHQVHRRTVRQAINDAVPPPRKTPARDAPVLGPFKDIIVGWLTDDLDVPRKQRHTAKKIFERIQAEGYRGGYTAIKDKVREWKRHGQEVFVPLDVAQIDSVVREQHARQPFSGVVQVREGGETVFATAFGYANRADAVPNVCSTRSFASSIPNGTW